MRHRWATKPAVEGQIQTECPRCHAWSSADRCPQCGAHKTSRGAEPDAAETAVQALEEGR